MRTYPLVSLLVVSVPLYLFPAIPFGPEPIRWDWLIILAILGIFAIRIVRNGTEAVLRLDRPQIWLLVFLAFVFLSVVRPAATGQSGAVADYVTTGIQLTINVALVVVLAHTDANEWSLAAILRLYILVTMAIAGFGIVQFLLANVFGITDLFPFTWTSLHYPNYFPLELGTPGRYDTLGVFRATSIFAEPRHLGNFLITPFLLGLTALTLPRIPLFENRLVLLLSACILGLGIVVSLSASALLVVAVGLVAMPLLTLDEPARIVRGYVLGGATTGVVILFGYRFEVTPIIQTTNRFIPSPYELRHFMDFNVVVLGPVKYMRGSFLALQEALTHPLFGVGLNQVYTNIDVGVPITIVPPFLLLASIGIPGFLAFVAFLHTALSNMIFVRAHYHTRTSMTYWLSTAAILLFVMAIVKSMLGSKYNYPNTWFWFEIGLAYMIYRNTLPASLEDLRPDSTNHRTYADL